MQGNTNYKTLTRSFAEKLVCFFIFLMVAFTIESLSIWTFSYSNWSYLANLKWIIEPKLYIAFYTLYFICLAVCNWSLWKNHSLKKLKLETSLFLIISLTSILWNYTFLIKQDYFLSLITNLFILFFSIILNLLIWKKEKLSAIIFLFCIIWSSYLFVLIMSLSITNT